MRSLLRPAGVSLTLLLALLFAGTAHGTEGTRDSMPLPEWDALTAAQRETLVAPVRERWNGNPGDRARILQRAERWQSMTPEQRERAHRGMQRWEHMDPGKRAQMKAFFDRTRDMPKAQRREAMALFHAMLGMTPAERDDLRQRWSRMNAGERQAWLREHAPQRKGHRHHDDGQHRDRSRPGD